MTPQPSTPPPEKVEPIIWLLAFMVTFFALLVVAISKWSPSDGQVFQVVSGMATTILGIFANRIMPALSKKLPPEPPPPGSTMQTHVVADQTVKTPPTGDTKL